jgi:hypothetical protein
MAAKTTSSRDVVAELAYLTRALKAPTLREAVERLAERARTETWTYEEFLAACLQREVSARESTARMLHGSFRHQQSAIRCRPRPRRFSRSNGISRYIADPRPRPPVRRSRGILLARSGGRTHEQCRGIVIDPDDLAVQLWAISHST